MVATLEHLNWLATTVESFDLHTTRISEMKNGMASPHKFHFMISQFRIPGKSTIELPSSRVALLSPSFADRLWIFR